MINTLIVLFALFGGVTAGYTPLDTTTDTSSAVKKAADKDNDEQPVSRVVELNRRKERRRDPKTGSIIMVLVIIELVYYIVKVWRLLRDRKTGRLNRVQVKEERHYRRTRVEPIAPTRPG